MSIDHLVSEPTTLVSVPGSPSCTALNDYVERLRNRLADHDVEGLPIFATDADDELTLDDELALSEGRRAEGLEGVKPDHTGNMPNGLFALFLSKLPTELQQHYNCRTCASFIRRYGGLVHVDSETGESHPLMWSPASWLAVSSACHLRPVFEALHRAVSKARITGVFVSSEPELGTRTTGEWKHLAVKNPRPWADKLQTAEQRAAKLRENFKDLQRSLDEYTPETLARAAGTLAGDGLARAEKHRAFVAWLIATQAQRNDTRHKQHAHNLMWLAVARAPAGWCQVRSNLVASLFDDIEDGLGFEDIRRRWAEKIDPLNYQRPKAPATAGNIRRAEEIVERLGIGPSLPRRFARLEDITTNAAEGSPRMMWRPAIEPVIERAEGGGRLFGHLMPKQQATTRQLTELLVTRMTFEKFSRELLRASTLKIEFYADKGVPRAYGAIITAVDPHAPPIIRWDRLEQRNPFSWYTYHGGSLPGQWNLSHSTWHEVQVVTMNPARWYPPCFSSDAHVAMFVLKDCRDMGKIHSGKGGGGLFPECLRGELHEVHSTLEAYYKDHVITDADKASACGVAYGGGSIMLRVTTNTTRQVVTLDRWD